MPFELSVSPEHFIRDCLVYAYAMKMLQCSGAMNPRLYSDLQIELRNAKSFLIQGGVSFLGKKVYPEYIYVKIRYKGSIQEITFLKSFLITDAKYILSKGFVS
jgi:hypothetical protein